MPTYKLMIKATWDDVKQIADRIASYFPDEGKDELQAVRMACTELIENVVKYADFGGEGEGPFLLIGKKEGKIFIRTNNRVRQPEDAANAIDHINKTNASVDHKELYVNRLRDMRRKRSAYGAQLGIYRIAYEGGFTLSYAINQDRLAVIAELIVEQAGLRDLKVDELHIRVVGEGDGVRMEWLGKSRMKNPGEILDPYLASIARELAGKRLTVDFTDIEYMNSSTIPSIIDFADLLNENRITAAFVYDKSEKWQAASFEAIGVVMKGMETVSLKGK